MMQGEVAERIGVKQLAYTEHEQPGRELRRSTLVKIADALEIITEYLDF